MIPITIQSVQVSLSLKLPTYTSSNIQNTHYSEPPAHIKNVVILISFGRWRQAGPRSELDVIQAVGTLKMKVFTILQLFSHSCIWILNVELLGCIFYAIEKIILWKNRYKYANKVYVLIHSKCVPIVPSNKWYPSWPTLIVDSI